MEATSKTQSPYGPQAQALTQDELYWKSLVDCGYGNQERPFVARLGRLSRLNITHLLNELMKIKADIRHRGTTDQPQMERLSMILHQYSEHICKKRFDDGFPGAIESRH